MVVAVCPPMAAQGVDTGYECGEIDQDVCIRVAKGDGKAGQRVADGLAIDLRHGQACASGHS